MNTKDIERVEKFLNDYNHFKSEVVDNQWEFGEDLPMIYDAEQSSGHVPQHYFHQDLIMANKIFQNNPERHVDIGSRLDGFIAHVAAFREIEVLDVRPLDKKLFNIKFTKQDLMDENFNLTEYCDSVSSLHVIEHMGLGRYGDPIDYNGHIKALDNIHKLLKPGGRFYFSVPMGVQKIYFNAHRVFSLSYMLDLFKEKYSIESFGYIDDKNELYKDIEITQEVIQVCDSFEYGCCLFELIKN